MILQQKLYKACIYILTDYDLKPTCGFIFTFLRCTLPKDTIDIDLAVRMAKGIHTFRKDHTTESATCSPWSRQMKHFLSVKKKREVLRRRKKMKIVPLHQIPSKLPKSLPPQRDPGIGPTEEVSKGN